MIDILSKEDCCGCTACQQICPQRCIKMEADSEGFLYPKVDISLCINCGVCEKVCPVKNRFSSASQPESYAARTLDEELRSSSSSGGIFTVVASKVIEENGVVFGARFADDWSIIHDYTESLGGLNLFRGSKYVQSKLGNTYSTIRNFLSKGRLVLFSGTPCQVSGLKHYLRKDYSNLYTIDMVCHSISSPKTWKLYLEELDINKDFTYITFREKEYCGWRNYGIRIDKINTSGGKQNIKLEGHIGKTANIYMRGFLENLTTRPSCFACPARCYTSGSDLMIADFWHLDKYHPDWDDDKGMSEVLLITDKGKKLFNSIKESIFCHPIPYEEVEDHGIHAPITSSTKPHRYRKAFFKYLKDEKISEQIHHYLRKNDIRNTFISQLKNIGRFFGLHYIKRMICKTKK